jgi:hypothetical protein
VGIGTVEVFNDGTTTMTKVLGYPHNSNLLCRDDAGLDHVALRHAAGRLGSDTDVFNLDDVQDTIFDNGAGNGEINIAVRSGDRTSQVSVKESGSGDLAPGRLSRRAASCCRRPATSTRWCSPTVR